MKLYRLITLSAIILILGIIGCAPTVKQAADYQQAQSYIEAEQYQKAETICRMLIAENPDEAKPYLFLARVYKAQGKLVAAVENYEVSLKFQPSKAVYLELAGVNLKMNRLNSALDNIEALESFKAELGEYSYILGQTLTLKSSADSLKELGDEAYEADRFGEAAELYRQACELNREDEDSKYYWKIAKGLYYFNKRGEDNYWEAITEFGEAAVIKSERGEPHYLMGICYEKKDAEDFNLPIQQYRRALELELTDYYREQAESRLQSLLERKRKLDAFWGRD